MSSLAELRDGYFWCDDKRFVPFGVNYWPGSTGPEMWRVWPRDEIARDLDFVQALGMNAVRFFLRWEDFQMAEDAVSGSALERAVDFVRMCGERGIKANPSLFIGWMSGKAFLPEWKQGRSMFTDPAMIRACRFYAREAGRALSQVQEHLFAVDFGNELDVLDDSVNSLPSEISAWCGAISSELRASGIRVPILSGADHQQAFRELNWRFDNQTGCDLFSIHGYPVPAWLPVKFAGRGDALGREVYPFALAYARVYGPAFFQEFGVLGAKAPQPQREYLEAMLPLAWEAGANGFLWWCLKDVDEELVPYNYCGFEAQLGLIEVHGSVREGHEPFIEFGRTLATRPAPEEADVAIYVPKIPYSREVVDQPGNNAELLSTRMLAAFHAVRALGRTASLTRDLPEGRILIVTGARLTVAELRALAAWVEQGGRLLFHGCPQQMWGPSQARLLGGEIADLRSPMPVSSTYGGSLVFSHWPEDTIVQASPTTAEVVSSDSEDRPIVFRHRLGQGVVIWSTLCPEDEIMALGAIPSKRDRWISWFSQALADLA